MLEISRRCWRWRSAFLREGRRRLSKTALSHDDMRRRAEEEAARAKRLKAYEKTLLSLWDSQWEFVQLTRLPSDVEKADDTGWRS